MKNLLFVAIILLAACAAPSETPALTCVVRADVPAEMLSVRSGPGVEYSAVSTLEAGQVVAYHSPVVAGWAPADGGYLNLRACMLKIKKDVVR